MCLRLFEEHSPYLFEVCILEVWVLVFKDKEVVDSDPGPRWGTIPLG
jgi:hypothetical protein